MIGLLTASGMVVTIGRGPVEVRSSGAGGCAATPVPSVVIGVLDATGALAVLGRTLGTDAAMNVGAASGGGAIEAASSVGPIATHSASALTASIRPWGGGGTGRGSSGTCAGRGGMLGGGGRIASRARS